MSQSITDFDNLLIETLRGELQVERAKVKALTEENERLNKELELDVMMARKHDMNARLEMQVKKLREALEAITAISWGYDGDCGAVKIAEKALGQTE